MNTLKKTSFLWLLLGAISFQPTFLSAQSSQNLYDIAINMSEDQALSALQKYKFQSNDVKKNNQLDNFIRKKKYRAAQYLINEVGYSADAALKNVNPQQFVCGVGMKKQPKTKKVRCKSGITYQSNTEAQQALDFTKFLISKNVKITNQSITNAVRNNELERAKLLIENYNDSEAINMAQFLYFAADRGYFDMIKYLIEEKGMDINTAHNGNIPIIEAVQYKDIVEYFISKGADINTKDKGGTSLIMVACANHGCYETAKMLLETRQVDLDNKNNYGHDVVSFCKMSNKRHKDNMKVMTKLLKEYM